MRAPSLRLTGTALVVLCLAIGMLSAWLWTRSTAQWHAHQTRAYIAGMVLFDTLTTGSTPPQNVTLTPLPARDQTLASSGNFAQITGAPRPALVTNVPIQIDPRGRLSGPQLTLAIISADLRYRVSDLPTRPGQTPAETTGALTRLLASYCSTPLVIARAGDRGWQRIDGSAVWGCAAAPPDRRLLAALIAALALGIGITIVLNTAADFTAFATRLRSRRRLGGPDTYDTTGPEELRTIVSAVNDHLATERAQLSQRAIVLSGVSHDLGTPATRLRLRTALIPDTDLRHKLEADIDSMTGMIDSVLTYTRAELNAEPARKLSLNSLIEAIAADYQDTGKDVTVRPSTQITVPAERSVFAPRQGHSTLPAERTVIVTARPISLQRAICNLIDNALKYGRRATVALETDADTATIVVEDQGADTTAAEIEALMAPFRRGDNTRTIDGYGLGLTIVATIANLHGGGLSFADTAHGLHARLTIQRH